MQTGDFLDKEIETLDLEALQSLQLERLKTTVRKASTSPFYAKRFRELGLRPEDIQSLSDVEHLPFTTKDDLRGEAYPYGFLTVPGENLVRLHASSGTTGRPTVIFHTKKDIRSWAHLVARCMYMAGVRKDDVFQNMMGYGLFTGGLGFHYGAELLETLIIPAGPGSSKRQIRLMQDFGTTVIHIIPSYALYLLKVMAELGINPRDDLSLRVAFLGAEPHTEGVRRRIEEAYGVDAFNSYGLSEMNGPGVALECPYKNGLHIWEDSYLVEIIDPVTLKPVPDGTEGELVLTSLNRDAMCLLRYRTKDITRLLPGRCPCGRTHRRIDRITGRTDDMIILKGVNIFPLQVEMVLMSIPEVGNNYQIVLETHNGIDTMRVQVEVDSEHFSEDIRYLEKLQKKIASELRGEILITPQVDLVEPNSLPRSDGKAIRVVDKRTVTVG
ncbi:MAG: phenylacetate--CoA ligase [Deltaproteobacteria bacterium]|nr:phenylacetate--CoA ligase [Deltaproteobacteria bacterium]RLC09048.1 MAG: phenylacetate--CoA ligase [Deltaproteobacteria bacterium]